MSSISEPGHLSGHHRDTLLQIFQSKTNHNVEWHDVVSFLEAVGSIEEQHDDMFLFRLGQETEVLKRPTEKDIDGQQLVDLRRILTSAGYDTVAAHFEAEGKEAWKCQTAWGMRCWFAKGKVEEAKRDYSEGAPARLIQVLPFGRRPLEDFAHSDGIWTLASQGITVLGFPDS
jgi:hypothetical protein